MTLVDLCNMKNPKELDLRKGSGALYEVQPTDYLAGSRSAITYEERLIDGQWGSLLPKAENQRAVFDTMACVSFSALNCVETQVRYLSGRELNYSDRFTAKMSGTTTYGNYAYKVGDSIRHDGLVDESEWPWLSTQVFDWETYYKEIDEQTIRDAKYFLQEYDVQYEWVTNHKDIKKHLKHTPLQIGVPICSPWNTQSLIKPCGRTKSDHAVMLYGYDEKGWLIYDHYAPYKKRLSYDYPIAWIFKYVITKNSNKYMELLENLDKKIVQDSEAGRSGTFGYVKNGKILVSQDQKDLLEILATEAAENRGTGLPAKTWDDLPKVNWKKRNEQSTNEDN